MHPYREPALNMHNSMWCCICEEYTKEAAPFKHPSGVGSVNVCFNCIDDYKHKIARDFECPMEVLEQMIILLLIFSERNRVQLYHFVDFDKL